MRTGSGKNKTESDDLLDEAVSTSIAAMMISQEYIDRLTTDMFRNRTDGMCNVTTLLTSQKQIDRMVTDLLKTQSPPHTE